MISPARLRPAIPGSRRTSEFPTVTIWVLSINSVAARRALFPPLHRYPLGVLYRLFNRWTAAGHRVDHSAQEFVPGHHQAASLPIRTDHLHVLPEAVYSDKHRDAELV